MRVIGTAAFALAYVVLVLIVQSISDIKSRLDSLIISFSVICCAIAILNIRVRER